MYFIFLLFFIYKFNGCIAHLLHTSGKITSIFPQIRKIEYYQNKNYISFNNKYKYELFLIKYLILNSLLSGLWPLGTVFYAASKYLKRERENKHYYMMI